MLGAEFDRVEATDASAEQIAQAASHPRVTYRVARAEESGLPDRSCDLVAAAQAAHWFDLPAYWAGGRPRAQARRACRPGLLRHPADRSRHGRGDPRLLRGRDRPLLAAGAQARRIRLPRSRFSLPRDAGAADRHDRGMGPGEADRLYRHLVRGQGGGEARPRSHARLRRRDRPAVARRRRGAAGPLAAASAHRLFLLIIGGNRQAVRGVKPLSRQLFDRKRAFHAL
ncbi:class I SAM-dependent methyltransferase [Skermanella pratensis]|uniref:class I SAM-dependent methyltransferase n=1 Tax=Skermanella pratensis TaxID=2233999 RepID=UPI003CCE4F88